LVPTADPGAIGGPASFSWLTAWASSVDPAAAVRAAGMLFLAGAAVAAAAPDRLWARGAALAGAAQFAALMRREYGPTTYLLVLTCAVLLLLPDGWRRRELTAAETRVFLTTVRGCQAAILLVYSMAGISKFTCGLVNLYPGVDHVPALVDLRYLISEHSLEIGRFTPAGAWLMGHPMTGRLLAWSAAYLELFSLRAVFHPPLQRAWGAALLLFHVGTYFIFRIFFLENAALIALFIVGSPFAPRREDLRAALGALPVFGRAFRAD
jgi:hypothetical protein